MVRTGAHGYVKYGYELPTTFATSSTTINKRFGLQEKISGWTINNNIQTLSALNQTPYEKFAYGTQSGSISLGFSLSNPFIFGALYGEPTTTTSSISSPHNSGYHQHVYGTTLASTQPKVPRSLSIDVGFQALNTSDADHFEIRKLRGCILNTLGLSASVGGLVEASTDFAYGNELAPHTDATAPTSSPHNWQTSGNATYPSASSNFPYTFAHARLLWGGTNYTTNAVAQIQEVSIDFATNSELIYALNSHHAVSAVRKIFDITGRFRSVKRDSSKVQHLIDQITQSAYSETIDNTDSAVKLEILFSRQNTSGAPQQDFIKIEGYGLTPTEYSTGMEPAELVTEEVPWRIKFAKVTAMTSETTAAATIGV